MNRDLEELDGAAAVNLVQRLAAADPDYAEAAREAAALSLPPLAPSRQAELARQTLRVLADDPRRAHVLAVLAQDRGAQRFDGGVTSATILVSVAVLLRTHVKFHRKPDGSIEFKIEYKPTDGKMLTELLRKVSSLLGG